MDVINQFNKAQEEMIAQVKKAWNSAKKKHREGNNDVLEQLEKLRMFYLNFWVLQLSKGETRHGKMCATFTKTITEVIKLFREEVGTDNSIIETEAVIEVPIIIESSEDKTKETSQEGQVKDVR